MLSCAARRTLGSRLDGSSVGLWNHCCLKTRQTTLGLVRVVAEVDVVGRLAEEDERVPLSVCFPQKLADVRKCYVLLVLESFAGIWHSQKSLMVAVAVKEESTAAVGPAVLAPRQDRNIRKGRQS